jgi:hypothetical protein
MKQILFFLLLFLLLFTITSYSQKICLEKIGRLPKWINESSGLAVAHGGNLWTINDRSDGNKLYRINNLNGYYSGPLWIDNARNTDWEDLTTDDSGTIYIGDFGNNTNRRHNLVVYKVRSPDSLLNNDGALIPELREDAIRFHYPDQDQFPPPPSNWNFDCEAFFHHNDSLYLFSKNNSNPNSGFTKMYRLPDQSGNYTAELIDSFQLGEPVTSADISVDGKMVVLLTYFSIWVFTDFQGHHFLKGIAHRFSIRGFTQREAIAFSDTNTLMITDERHFGRGGKLYSVDLRQLNFAESSTKYRRPFLKHMIYNYFNNPKVTYRKIMEREASQ